MKNGLELVPKPEAMHSVVALTFEAEIKRMSVEREESIGDVMAKLAEKTGLCESQLYNYRQGKTDIPAMLIPVFCSQFHSNALAMAVVSMCDVADFDAGDGFDLARLIARLVQDMLKSGVVFLDVFEDNRVTGHELVRLKNVRAQIIRDANRLFEIAEQAHARRAA